MSILPSSLVNEIAESFGYQLAPEASALLLEDSEFRLRQVLQESFKFLRNSKTQKLLKQHVNSTLKVKNLQKIYGNEKTEYSHHNSLYYQKDAEIDLEELVNLPLPEISQEVTFTAHWLAIEGVQPRIVQNPTNNTKQQPTDNDDTGIKNIESGLVKAVLSRELQVYFDKVTTFIFSKNAETQELAIDSISSDPGIQALMPYFIIFISDQTTTNLKHYHTITSILKFIQSLLQNPHLFIDPYLHQLVPIILTCIVARNLALDGNAMECRMEASKVLRRVCERVNGVYPGLQARVTKTLVRALLDSTKSVQTVLGACLALAEMGREVVDLVLIPNLGVIGSRLRVGKGDGYDIVVKICKSHYERSGWDVRKAKEGYGVFYDGVVANS